MQITDHAKIRAKERLNLNSKSLERLAEKAFDKGLKSNTAKAKLKKYLDKLYLEYKTGYGVVYGEIVYVFIGEKLITLWQLPRELLKYTKI